ncbi:MAG: type 2 isopentenyl-diphosphate Delta-isomerase [Balneolaceae bacterium]
MGIEQRKKDHTDICLNRPVHYDKGAGFDRYDFVHNALPELDLDDITTEATLLGRTFAFPLFVSSMTGGYNGAQAINRQIASFCQRNNLPFGVGSQRAMLEKESLERSFAVVRDVAPDAFICANIGGAQLRDGLSDDGIQRLIDIIRADAVIVHLNPLQELLQEEGDRNFSGIEEGISRLVTMAPCPVIVKETGAGISGDVARRLLHSGVDVIDLSGAGGTSWARVENLRNELSDSSAENRLFEDWGIPTARCLESVQPLREQFKFQVIASGGIRTVLDMGIALALGADFVAMARPVLVALHEGGEENLERIYQVWRRQFRQLLLLTGCRRPSLLSASHIRKRS